jgi:putative CocE/NonD family hydrolase
MSDSQTATDIVVERNVMVPMRDGVKLATDVFRPVGEGRWPVLVTRMPYNKELLLPDDPERRVFMELDLDSQRVIRAGYVIVIQDTRGRFASEGVFVPFADERNDGADTIAWAAKQPWSSGQVGMYGISYQGITQWQAAADAPPALKAIAPGQSPGIGWYPYQGGAFWLSVIAGWTATQGVPGDLQRQVARGEATQGELEAVVRLEEDLSQVYEHLPLVDVPAFRDRAPYYVEWLSHPGLDDYWRRFGPEDTVESITVPAFVLAGWYDYFLTKDLASYKAMRERAGSELARKQTRLIVGPWSHGNFWAYYPNRRELMALAGQDAIDLTGMQLRWFDRWLKGVENGADGDKPVRIFVLGTNLWRDEDDWPLPATQYRPYYLHSGGRANGAGEDGTLSVEQPGEEPQDVYHYDPHDPVPSLSPAIISSEPTFFLDQRPVEDRVDVLCYASAPIERPLEVTGPVRMVLYASSSALDSDFTGKLVDVHPDGYAELLTDGILRARYSDSLSQPALMEARKVHELAIDLGATANVFLPGHRIRLEVSSSNFPRFDRNTNTGGVIATEGEADFVTAVNTIYHNRTYPSHIILPVIERD